MKSKSGLPAFLLVALCILCIYGYGQKDSATIKAATIVGRLSDKMLVRLEKKYHKLGRKLKKTNLEALAQFQKKEERLHDKLDQKDSISTKTAFTGSEAKYAGLLQIVQNPSVKANASALNDYLPRLDSLQTAFNFLEKAGTKIPGIPTDKLKQIQDLSAQLKNLQAQVLSATDIKKFIAERKQLLKEQLDKFGMSGQLKSINKQVYYYQQQINEYKAIINDPKKLEGKALGIVRNSSAFKDFMSKNSFLAQLFPIPNGYGTVDALVGLQTRSNVQQQLTRQLGSGANSQQYLQQQVAQAQNELKGLKDKVNKLGGGSSDLVIPDFKPNTQKTKSFLKRIEYGLNIQSQKTNAFLPTTSDIALTAGYKLNDKSTIGFGAGYKLGWGKNISNIHITNQGVSLRSYIDIKIKGSTWICGGYEENYQHEFKKIDELKDMNAWQHSGLIGLTKKYKIGKKNGNMQLLWDFLSYNQTPRTQALKFRIGYSF